MSNSVLPMLFLASIIGGGIVVFVFFAHVQLNKLDTFFGEIAQTLRLHLHLRTTAKWFRHYPEVAGKLDNRDFRLYMFTESPGKSQYVYTAFTLSFNNIAGGSLTIFKERIYHKIGKSLGMIDIRLGDEVLDKQYVIQSYNTAFTQKLLNPPLRARLKDLHPAFAGRLELKGHQIEYREMTQLTNIDKMTHFLKVIDFARKLAVQAEEPFEPHEMAS